MMDADNSSNTNNDEEDDPFVQQVNVVEGLTNLAGSLKDLNDQQSAPFLSHYRHLPGVIAQSYDLLQQGAQLVHGTSTKYTLLAKLDTTEQSRMAQDLLRGCQLIGTACVVLHDDQSGCSRSTRHHCKRAARAIVHSVIQLVEVWLTEGERGVYEKGDSVGAQKTGAVWQMCDVVLERKLPQGNRNAMRRDLLTFMMDCAETFREFQEIIERGPSLQEESSDGNGDACCDDDLGDDDQYSSQELPVAEASLFLVKNSRGCLNLALQAIEAVGQELPSVDKVECPQDKARLGWMSKLHDLARNVGEGVTDLGTSMYLPLQLQTLGDHVERQSSAIQAVLDFVTDGKLTVQHDDSVNEIQLEFSEEVNDLLVKVGHGLLRRRDEANNAIQECNNDSEL